METTRMAEEPSGWKWWKKGGVGLALVLVVLLAGSISFRERWVEPLPGVRTAMTRPFVRESDLGPGSAYMLLLQAIRLPAGAGPAPAGDPVWHLDWTDAVVKFDAHPWPTEPPPPAPKPPQTEEEPEPDPGDLFAPVKTGSSLSRSDPALAADAPWTREQCEDLARLAKLYEPNLAILDRALTDPNPQVPTPDSPEFLLPYLQNTRQLARWLVVEIRYKAAIGNYAGAARDLERTLGMADIVSRGGCLINHLVTIACDALACEAAWFIATRHDLPLPVLKRVARSLLAHADAAEPFVEAMRNEALVNRASIDIIYREGLYRLMGSYGGPPDKQKEQIWKAIVLVGPLAGSTPTATKRSLDACYQHFVALAEKPWSPEVGAAYDEFTRDLAGKAHDLPRLLFRYRDPVGLVTAAMFLPALTRSHERRTSVDATLRALALFYAVKAYQKERGKLPDRLEQLVPDYLPRVPMDPFANGKPLHYLRNGVPRLPANTWGIYSNGSDFADDGGKAWSVGKSIGRQTLNPDLVWPSQKYPERVIGK
jgi:hypothetical protein